MKEYSINIEGYEKLKVKVAELLEEREEYLKEKQIIIG